MRSIKIQARNPEDLVLNRDFRIVFQPKNKHLYEGKRRFAVGAYSLHKYVGHTNAKNAIYRALSEGNDKLRVKLRNTGIIDFYAK